MTNLNLITADKSLNKVLVGSYIFAILKWLDSLINNTSEEISKNKIILQYIVAK